MPDFDEEIYLSENPTLRSIARLTDNETAKKLSYDFGGKRIYIPKKPGEHYPLTVSIGLENAKKICDAYGGLDFDVPLCLGKYAKAMELKKNKVSMPKIAGELGCTERHVYRIINAVEEDKNQLNLF